MGILQEGVNAVANLFGDSDDSTLRERLLDPNNIEQKPTEPVVSFREPAPEESPDTYEGLEEYELASFAGDTGDFDPWEGEDFNLEPEGNKQEIVETKLYDDAEQGFNDDSLGLPMTKHGARKDYFNDVKIAENGSEKGLTKTPTDERFMPFDSIEGTGPDASMSKQEIGYGVKIPKKWFSDDKNKWPMVEGVRIDIKKGITRDQATAMTENIIDDSFKQASSKFTKWEDMSEMEKVFWADLTYNGGAKAINKNPKARAAANAGRTVEGMVLALDFIKANDKPMRGLLNRRLSRYNQAALEITGTPVVEEYVFGKEIKIKFSSDFMTDKISEKLAKKIKANDGWLTVSRGGDNEDDLFKADDNYKF